MLVGRVLEIADRFYKALFWRVGTTLVPDQTIMVFEFCPAGVCLNMPGVVGC